MLPKQSNRATVEGAVYEGVNELKKCWVWSIPLLAEEGWLRHRLKVAKPPKRRRRARSASAIARSRNSGQLGEIFRPEQFRRTDHPGRAVSERIHFYLWRVHPSSARRGIACASSIHSPTDSRNPHGIRHFQTFNTFGLVTAPFEVRSSQQGEKHAQSNTNPRLGGDHRARYRADGWRTYVADCSQQHRRTVLYSGVGDANAGGVRAGIFTRREEFCALSRQYLVVE